MKINKEGQERGIKNRIEAPAPNPGASGSGEVVVEHETRNCEAEDELDDLAVGDGALPGGADAEGAEEVVTVHDDVDGGIGEERDGEEGLGGLEPEVAHEEDGGVVVDVEEGEASEGAGEDDEERIEEFEDFGEVEDVGPEEEGPGGIGVGWEADGPAEVRGVDEEGEGAAQEHEEGEEEEEEVVEGGDGLQEAVWEGWEREEGEEEGEGEVAEDGETKEERGGERGVRRLP